MAFFDCLCLVGVLIALGLLLIFEGGGKGKAGLLLLLAQGLTACKSGEPAATAGAAVRYERVVERDTAYITLPAQTRERVAADSVSVLTADSVTSVARVLPGGLLWHTLSLGELTLAAPVDKVTERRDSVATVTVEVEKDLTAWQSAQIWAGRAFLVLLAAGLVYAASKLGIFRVHS